MSSFRQPITGYRWSDGSRIQGKWTDGTQAPFTIQTSVQPLSARDLETLPESRRATGESYKLYTNSVLRTIQNSEQPDQVTLFGDQFEIFSGETWSNAVIPHNKYVATRLTNR